MNYEVCRTALATPGLLVIQWGSEQFKQWFKLSQQFLYDGWPGDQELQAGKDWKN